MKRVILALAVLGSLIYSASGTRLAPALASSLAGTPTATPTATQVPTLPPGPTTVFYVLGVRFEHNWAGKDWNVNKKPQKTARPGTKVQLAVYFNVSAVPGGSRSLIGFTLNRNGRTILSKSYLESVPRPENYKWYLKGVPLPTAGTYKLAIRVTVNGITDQGSATLKVK
jgi:hypothetical protein